MARALINVPPKAKRGEVIEIKTLISHVMETGFRHTATGDIVSRATSSRLSSARYNGEEIFRADCFRRSRPIRSSPSSPSRPRAARFEFEWTGDNGFSGDGQGQRSRSNETASPMHGLASSLLAACRRAALRAAPRSRRTSAAPATSFMAPETRAMQDDDTANPGMLWVLDGEALWRPRPARAGRPAPTATAMPQASMKGVAARYPAFDASSASRSISKGASISAARKHQKAPPLAHESNDLLALSAFVARQSRGMPIAAGQDPRARAICRKRPRTFTRRQGQLNLSCANCHDDNWGKHLAGIGDPAGPSDRLSALSAGMADARLAAAPAAQLHVRHPGAAL